MRFTLLVTISICYAFTVRAADYQACSSLVTRDANEALRMAEQMLQEKPHPSAYHCRAMALFALKRYAQAAGALERLSSELAANNPVLWGNVIRQAARSWRLADDNAKAIVTLSNAIAQTTQQALSDPLLARLTAELLLERSALYRRGGRDLFALQDLDQALSLSPNHPQLLHARAELLLAQQEAELAAEDVSRLNELNPNYPGLERLRGQLP